MKSSLWIVIAAVTGLVGFLMGYSTSAYTGIRKIEAAGVASTPPSGKSIAPAALVPPVVAAPASAAPAAAGYGAPRPAPAAGGYGSPATQKAPAARPASSKAGY